MAILRPNGFQGAVRLLRVHPVQRTLRSRIAGGTIREVKKDGDHARKAAGC